MFLSLDWHKDCWWGCQVVFCFLDWQCGHHWVGAHQSGDHQKASCHNPTDPILPHCVMAWCLSEILGIAVPSSNTACLKIGSVGVRIIAIGMMNAAIKKVDVNGSCISVVGKNLIFGSSFFLEVSVVLDAMRFDEVNVVGNGALIKSVLFETDDASRGMCFLFTHFDCLCTLLVFFVFFWAFEVSGTSMELI